MELFAILIIGHLVGDFLLQPGWLVAAKRSGLFGLLLHAGIIGVTTAALIPLDLVRFWWLVLLACAAHMVIEVLTISLRQRTPMSGMAVFIADQVFHAASLGALVFVARRDFLHESTSLLWFDLDVTQLWTIAGILFVTLFGSILVFEAINRYGAEEDRRELLPLDLPRIMGMVERGTSLVAAIWITPAAIIVPFLPRFIAYIMSETGSIRRRRLITALTGLILNVITFAGVRAVQAAGRFLN